MKKKLMLGLLAIFLLVGGVLAYAALNANRLINQYKPDIEKAASSALGSKVTLGALDVNVFPSVNAKVDAFKIAPKSGPGDGVTLKNLTLKIDLLPLLSGNLSIKKLSLDSPELIFIKDASGMSIAGLPKAEAAPKVETQSAPPASSGSGSGPVPSALSLSLKEFALTNASITVKDQVQAKDFKIENINVSAALELVGSLAKLSNLKFSGKALSKLDLGASGNQLGLDLGSGVLAIGDLTVQAASGSAKVVGEIKTKQGSGAVKISSAQFTLNDFLPLLKDFVPAMAAATVSGAVNPQLDVSFGPGTYSAAGSIGLQAVGLDLPAMQVSEMNGNLGIGANQAAQSAFSENLAFKVGGEAVKAALKASVIGNNAELTQFDLTGLGGTASAAVKMALDTKGVSGLITAKGLQVDQTLRAALKGKDLPLAGTVESFKFTLGGALAPEPMKNIRGNGSVAVKDGAIKGFNLAQSVLKAVNNIPFISGALYGAVPAGQKGAVDSNDTAVKTLQGDFAVANGYITTQNMVMDGGIFTVNASGRIGFDTTLDLKTTMYFSSAFSLAMAAGIKELDNLLDDNDRLVIPVLIQGRAGAPIILPDVEKLLTVAGKKVLMKQAEKKLGEALGGASKGLGSVFGF